MKIKERLERIKEGFIPALKKLEVLRPTVRRVAFMLILFAVLSLFVFAYNESYCLHCETGRCECRETSILGFGLWIDLAIAAVITYLAITIIALVWKT